MKICLYSDPHWSQKSSIFSQRGKKYSRRLETLIDSINWVEQLAVDNGCDRIICLGDFFDRNDINAEEVTALTEIKWSNIPKQFLVGNHEIVTGNNVFNTLNGLSEIGEIISSVKVENVGLYNLVFIPYIDEDNRKPLLETIPTNTIPNNIIFSHNDIKGIRYGKYISETGFSISEIEQCSELYINGHLHNSSFVNDRETILNLGNLSGQNFTEDAFNHRHYACILDTDTLQLQFFENPYAVNFYNIVISDEKDLPILNQLSNNSIISVKVSERLYDVVKSRISELPNIIASRMIIISQALDNEKQMEVILSKVEPIEEFKTFCLNSEQLGDLEIVRYELDRLCE